MVEMAAVCRVVFVHMRDELVSKDDQVVDEMMLEILENCDMADEIVNTCVCNGVASL